MTFIRIVTVILILALVGIPLSVSAGPGAIWTTVGTCQDPQDKNQYLRGETVYIHGEGFEVGRHDWAIEGQPGNASGDPGIVVASGTIDVDETGSFCFPAYTIPQDDWGEYTVKFDGVKGDAYRVDNPTAVTDVPVQVFLDLDLDAQWDAWEPPLKNWTIAWSMTDGTSGFLTTDEHGSAMLAFDMYDPGGLLTLTNVLPPGWQTAGPLTEEVLLDWMVIPVTFSACPSIRIYIPFLSK